MLILVILNTILSIGSGFASLGMTMGVGYAQERKRGRGAAGNIVMFFTAILPLIAAISILGSWLTLFFGNTGAALAFMGVLWGNVLCALGGLLFLYSG